MTTSLQTTTFDEILRQAGAHFDADDRTPEDFGDPDTEYTAVREAAALAVRTDRALLVLRGEDRARFLHGLVTCDVQALAAGEGAYGYFTSPQGKILADAAVLASGDELAVSIPAGTGDELTEHLRRYIIMDRVTVETEDARSLTIAGPGAVEALRGAGLDIAEDATAWHHGRTELAAVPVRWVVDGRLGVPGVTLWTAASDPAPVWERLAALAGMRPVGHRALETARVEEGIPRFGADFGSDNLPQETGDETAVSYTKGCYLGQEVVARIHYRGKVNRELCGLRIAGDTPPPAGSAIAAEGREIGTLGSAVLSPRFGGVIGLAVLHRRGGESGASVEVGGERPATVEDLPFTAQNKA